MRQPRRTSALLFPLSFSRSQAATLSQYSPDELVATQALKAERRAAFKQWAWAMRSAVIATATWGLVTGVAMVKSGLTESIAIAMTLLAYAGSAQLTSMPSVSYTHLTLPTKA